jgi:zinc protease
MISANDLRMTLAAALALALFALSGTDANATDAKSSTFKLANGMQVVVLPDHHAPVVTHLIMYRAGSADEPPGKSGIAHFLEHLMFKGTEKNPAGRFSQMLGTIGGQENAFTTFDYTGYYQRVPREYLKTVMGFEADRMTGLVLSDANVLPERNVVLEEYNMRVANSPEARLNEQISAALYLNHPYGRPVIGWRSEIEKLGRKDALGFYHQFYRPENAVVVVVGDVTADEVKALAEKTYGAIKGEEATARLRPQEPPPVAVRRLTMADARVAHPGIYRTYLVPSYANAKDGEAEAIDVLAQILGANSNSRLYRHLVVEKRVATNAGAAYRGPAVDNTRLTLYANPAPNESLPAVEKEIDAVIAGIAESGVTADELERAKTRMIADAIYAQDSQLSMARWFGTALTTGSTVQDLLTWPDRVKKVTAADVQAAAKTWLDRRHSVTGYLVKSLSSAKEKRS